MQTQSSYLSLRSIRAGYQGNAVLRDIGLDVGKGQFVALLGASGCGKTTLLRTIAGFEKPVSGQVLVDGRDVTALPPDRRGMSMVFQSYALWPHKTVDEHIAYGLKLRGMPRDRIAARVRQLADMLGLGGLGGRKPAALSGGQRQRVALGRALAVRPEILLLDEPLSNLDARIRLQLRNDIRALQQQLGITAIHVTHDREEAMVMADRIVILQDGQIMQDGAPHEIYNRPKSAFVAGFMGAENSLMLEAVRDGGLTRIRAGRHNDALLAAAPLPAGPVEARFRSSGLRLFAADAAESPAPGTLVLHGHVTGCAYPGGEWLHHVSVGSAQIQVLARQSFAPRQQVRLHVPDDALFLFGADTSRDTHTGAGPQGDRIAGPLHA